MEIEQNQEEEQNINQEIDQEFDSEETIQKNIDENDSTFDGIQQLNTPLGDIDYRPDLKLSRASIVQLLVCYVQRLGNQKISTDNKWQKMAYPKLWEMFANLSEYVIKAIKNLCNEPDLDQDVIIVNFCGYKNFRLPLVVQTQGVHHKATYSTVNVRPFLKTLEQRLTYLSVFDIPSRYRGDEKKVKTFIRVQHVAKEILENHVRPLYDAWNLICQEAATFAGITMPLQEQKRSNRRLKNKNSKQTYRGSIKRSERSFRGNDANTKS